MSILCTGNYTSLYNIAGSTYVFSRALGVVGQAANQPARCSNNLRLEPVFKKIKKLSSSPQTQWAALKSAHVRVTEKIKVLSW